MESAPKKRKIEPNRNNSSQTPVDKIVTSPHHSSVPESPAVQVDSRVQQAKKFAVAQAQLEGCLGNYRSFDSPFGNYLVPVIPTRADLFGE
ncbi:uncharacterized protein LOC109717037 [Ananas comosus]|uniref:Uncharacterized protein LOC109717037 n=1 Tax=Ananas comosus TaxID=4615 RepID=A0A6P5FRF8_ANACO|nr:uncharacterized protein LOC109717037 [Ananas comosus]